MLELVELGVLTNQDIVDAVTTEFPACRSGFKNEEGTSDAEAFHPLNF